VLLWALLSVGVLAGWGIVYTVVLGPLQEQRAQHILYSAFRGELATGTAPIDGRITPGAPVAMLQIPRIGVHNLIVVEGTTSGELEAGPGHRRDTPLPGEVGTSFLFGRSSRFGAPFGRITRLRAGDAITAKTGEGTVTFHVDAVRRPGDPLSGFDPGASRLTLVTSEVAKGGLRQVVYVDATRQGQGQPASQGRPASLPAAESQLRANRAAWLGIVLWLQGLLICAVALTWVRRRWGLAPTLVTGVPIVLAVTWGVAEAFSQLLPNLI
jgi:sortase A